MSYILDALKKSEQERKLGDLPNISSEHQSLYKTQDKSISIYFAFTILILVVVASLIFSLFYFIKNKDLEKGISSENVSSFEKSQVSSVENKKINKKNINSNRLEGNASSKYAGNVEEASVVGSEIIRPSKERRDSLQKQQEIMAEKDESLKREYQNVFSERENLKSPERNETSEQDSESVEKLEETEEAGDRNETLESTLDENIIMPSWDDYESIAELSQTVKQQIPTIKVTTHIFSSVESYRKVTVNGYSVTSGDEISDGLVVERILEEGVIFSFKGVYFRMKALEVWEG